MTCTFPASRARRKPIASATAPPAPVSISSNTKVGAEPRSASTTFSASRKRASSPPDATFISGPRSEEHTSELQSRLHLVCRLLLEKKNQHRDRQNCF